MKNQKNGSKIKILVSCLILIFFAGGLLPQAVFASDKTVTVDKLSFNVKLDGKIYRTWRGGPQVVVKATVTYESPPSPANLHQGDKLSQGGPDVWIQGFYIASVKAGTTNICGTFTCDFTDEIPNVLRSTTPSFQANLTLNTNNNSKYPLPAGATVEARDTWIFPVLNIVGFFGTSTIDAPLTNSPQTITVHVYKDQGAFNQAAKDSGILPGDFSKQGTTEGNTTGTNTSRPTGEILSGFLLSVVNAILGIIFAILRWIVWILGSLIFIPLLEATLSLEAGNIAGGPILVGWTLVRDVVNMLFILFLIIIGFATILRIEGYNYRKLLVNLIVMALLVNFSLVIGRIIIQIADSAQFNFLPIQVQGQQGQVSGTTGVKYIFNIFSTVHIASIADGFRAFTFDVDQATAATFSMLFQFLLELGVIITFGALAIFMLIRTIALWILLIISPLAYALFVLPATAGLAKKWWSTFIKYVLFAPIIAFFLRLSLELYRRGLQIFPDRATWSDRGDLITQLRNIAASSGGFSFQQALELGLIYVVILAFLWAGLIVARNMGIFGAGMIMSLAERGVRAPLSGTWKTTKFAGRAFDKWLAKGAEKEGLGFYNRFRRGVSYLSPVGWKKGWEARKQQKEFEAYTVAGGKRADLFNRVISRQRTDFALRAQQARVNDELKNITTKNREELATLYDQALREKNPFKAMAYANRMAQNYDLNELLSYRGYTTTHEGLQEMIRNDLIPLIGEQAAYRAGYDLSRMAEEVHHWNMARAFTGTYNPQTRQIIYSPNPNTAAEVRVELSKLGRRDQIGRGNRLAWGFAETDVNGERVEREWTRFGRDRWAGEVADTEFKNQFNMNAAMNIMLKHSKDALQLNKAGWLTLANEKLAKLNPQQLQQWSAIIARPEAGWAAAEADHQVFSMEAVHEYRRQGLLADSDIQSQPELRLAYEQWHQMALGTPPWGGGTRGTPGGTPPPTTPPTPTGGVGPVPGGAPGGAAPGVPPTAPPVPGLVGGGPRNVMQQVVNQIIGEVEARHNQTVRDVVREFHAGNINMEDIERRLSSQGINPGEASRIANRITQLTAENKVQSVGRDVFASVPGIDPSLIQDAVRQGMEQGLVQGARLGTAAMGQSIARRIVQVAPNVRYIEDRAQEIAREINRPERT